MVPGEYVKDGKVSSGAFNYPNCFSVDIVSRSGGAEESLARVPRACAVIRFNCGCAREVGDLDTRDELDDAHPENLAHAHVYTNNAGGRRKALAKRFVVQCQPAIVVNNCVQAGG